MNKGGIQEPPLLEQYKPTLDASNIISITNSDGIIKRFIGIRHDITPLIEKCEFPVFTILNIDGFIIEKIDSSKQSEILLDAIIAFSQKLDIKTIAEFVSNKQILDIVKAKGIDYAQGFFIGKSAEL